MSASEKKRKISQESGNDFQSQEYPLSDRKSVAPRKVPKRRGEESSFQISQRDHWNYLVQKTFQLYESELTERNGGKFHTSIALEIRRVLEEIKSKYCPTIGDVFVTGSNDGCQLGGAVSVSVSRLTLFKQLVDARIVHVTCGSMSNFILDQQGRVYSWGSSDKGALGRRTDTEADPDTEFKAIQITGFMPSRMAPAFRTIANDDKSSNNDENDDTNILQVVAGGSHVLFLSNHGSVYVAGSYVMDNKSWREEAPPDQPDQDYTDTELYEGAAPRGFRDQPRHVYRLPQLADKIFAGTSMSAARLVDGTLMTWGSDAKGELGRGSTEENCEIVLNPKDKNEKKRAFDIMKHDFLVPKPVKYSPAIGKHIVLDVACGQNHMLVVLREEDSFETKVYGTGLNQYGQLGLGDATNRNVLTLLPDSIGKNIVSVSAGLFHSIFLDITGRHIYTCGRCDSGQLGLQESTYEPGDFRNRLQKVLFDEADPEEDLEFKSIAAGENSSFAVTRTGKLYSWGFGEMGQLGHGKEADQLQATPISNFVKVGFVLEVSSGSQHTIVLANRDMIKS